MELKSLHPNLKYVSMSSKEDYFEKASYDIGIDNDVDGIFKWFNPANNYAETVINAIRNSSTLESILFEDLIYKTGGGFNTSDASLSNYLNKDIVNVERESFKTVFKDSNDYFTKLGNVFIESIFDDQFRLLSISTIQPQKCRLIRDKKSIWMFSDFSKFDKNKAIKMPLYPRMKKFKSNGVVYYKSIHHIKNKVLGFDHYGINEKLIEAMMLSEKEHRRNNHQLSQIKKGFKRDFFLVTDFPLTEGEKKKNDESFDRISGDEHAGGVETIEAEGATLVPASGNVQYDYTKDDTKDLIFLKMGFPRSLVGIKSGAAFSVEQIESDYDQYLPKIEAQQSFLMGKFAEILNEHTDYNTSDVNVINNPPSAILQNYMKYMNEEQKNKVIEKILKRYGI